MRVKATQLGYYGHKRRKVGEVFDLSPIKAKVKGKDVLISPDQQFSERWMVKVKKGAKVPEPEPDFDEESEGEEPTGDDAGSDDQDVI